MTNHLRLELHGGVESLARVTARLHALGTDVRELHLAGSDLCLHLADGAQRHRVSTVLARLADVDVVPEVTHTCANPLGRRPWLRTTYVVQSEALASAGV